MPEAENCKLVLLMEGVFRCIINTLSKPYPVTIACVIVKLSSML